MMSHARAHRTCAHRTFILHRTCIALASHSHGITLALTSRRVRAGLWQTRSQIRIQRPTMHVVKKRVPVLQKRVLITLDYV